MGCPCERDPWPCACAAGGQYAPLDRPKAVKITEAERRKAEKRAAKEKMKMVLAKSLLHK
jgi:hypothetical protein